MGRRGIVSDTTGEVTEEQVREGAARLRALLERRSAEGSHSEVELDVEAATRRALEARGARPKLSAHDVLGAIRPEWEREAAQRELTGETLNAFARQILETEGPQVQCEVDGFNYYIHLNKSAAQLAITGSGVLNSLLQDAAEEFLEISAILLGIMGYISAEKEAIESAAAQGNGQVCLEGVFPDPFFVPMSDSGYVFEVYNASHIFGG
jgi:hypothetical protein